MTMPLRGKRASGFLRHPLNQLFTIRPFILAWISLDLLLEAHLAPLLLAALREPHNILRHNRFPQNKLLRVIVPTN